MNGTEANNKNNMDITFKKKLSIPENDEIKNILNKIHRIVSFFSELIASMVIGYVSRFRDRLTGTTHDEQHVALL